MREQANTKLHGAERTMNMITIEANVIETEVTGLQSLATPQSDDAILELSSAQLLMVGGGASILLD
jgi:hypothetical protein